MKMNLNLTQDFCFCFVFVFLLFFLFFERCLNLEPKHIKEEILLLTDTLLVGL